MCVQVIVEDELLSSVSPGAMLVHSKQIRPCVCVVFCSDLLHHGTSIPPYEGEETCSVLCYVFFHPLLIILALRATSCMKYLKKTEGERDMAAVVEDECRWRSKFVPVLALDDV